MNKLPVDADRNQLLRFLCRAATYGNLGLFVGAGFSKAVLNSSGRDIALSWHALLMRAAKQIDIDMAAIAVSGLSFPEIATKVCKARAAAQKQSYEQSLSDLKRAIAHLTAWYPDQKMRERFGGYLQRLNPRWIITTNYDLVLESLLPGKSIPLGPGDPVSSPQGIIPIYHLHGIRTNPDEIIISQEDYVALFRPNEYRQIRLALTVKESTTLLIGYGLGDVNVLTALDWSSRVFEKLRRNYPNEVVQVLHTGSPADAPYLDPSGIWILEAAELTDFFDQLLSVHTEELKREMAQREALERVGNQLSDPTQDVIDKFIDDASYRRRLIRAISAFPVELVGGFISLLYKAIDETWRRSEPVRAFSGYDQNLTVLLDILIGLEYESIPPALFQSCAYALDRVAPYVGETFGRSWAAANTWRTRRVELSERTVQELKNIAHHHSYLNLLMLLG